MITIIGSGRIGSNVAMQLALRKLDDISLIDVVENLPKGEALDIGQALPGIKSNFKIKAGNYDDVKDSEIIIITAGFSRKPNETRIDLLKRNLSVIKDICGKISKNLSNQKIILTSNPVDILTYATLKILNYKERNVIGMGSLLDSYRFIYFISLTLNVPIGDIEAMTIGEHGDTMIPLYKRAKVKDKLLTEIADKEKISEIIKRTRNAGAEIISLKGATFYAPSVAVAETVEAILKDKKEIIPSSVYLENYDLCIGFPVKIGRNGVEEIIDINFDEEEKNLFEISVKEIKKNIDEIRSLLS
ncbi:MAG: malate dehydrogenase [Candidatus Altarchaeaceae archaeon]